MKANKKYVSKIELDQAIESVKASLELSNNTDVQVLSSNYTLQEGFKHYHLSVGLNGIDIVIDLTNLELSNENNEITVVVSASAVAGGDRTVSFIGSEDVTIQSSTMYDGGSDNVAVYKFVWDYTEGDWYSFEFKATVDPAS